MLDLLDVRTLFFSGALTAGMFATLMFLTRRRRTAYSGHLRWALAEVCFAILFLMQCIRGFIPEIVPILIGNAAVAGAMVLLAEGMREFCGKRPRNFWFYVLSTAYLSAALYYYFVRDSFQLRTLVAGLYMALMSGYAAQPLQRQVPVARRFGYRLATAILSFGMVAGLVRVVVVARTTEAGPYFFKQPVNTFFYLFLVSYVVGITFSLVVLMGERQISEIKDSNRSLMHEVHERHNVERKLLNEIAERQALETQLREMVVTDPLTGLLNRRGFFNQLHAEIQRARRYPASLSVLVMDVDRFKTINDTYGHSAGDLALLTLATACLNSLRAIDKMGRIGGEEFAVVLPGTNLDGARIIAEKLRLAVGEAPVSPGDGTLFAMTVSIGIAVWNAEDASGDELMHQADRALYAAKEAGRNRSCALAG